MALPARYIQGNETPEEALTRILVRYHEIGLYSEEKWRINPESSTSDEVQIAEFFNEVVECASDLPDKRHRWRSRADRMAEGHRNPEAILVLEPEHPAQRSDFGPILTCCEVQKTVVTKEAGVTEWKRLMDIGSRVISIQKGRRFFVGLGLCNSDLTVALFVRGCTVFTCHINIHEQPLTFLHILLTITDASPTWLGFDPRFNVEKNTATIRGVEYVINRTLFRSVGMLGRGTVVYLLELAGDPSQYFALKQSWVCSHWHSDVDTHKRMEAAEIAPFMASEDEEIFGEADILKVFKYCVPSSDAAAWDYVRKLPGIPVIQHVEVPTLDLPHHKEMEKNGRYKEKIREDTTAHIVDRITAKPGSISIEPRIHIEAMFHTIGVPITMFSCRRELLNALMCISAALFNGLRMGILHADVSQSNLILRVAKIDEEDAIPVWRDSSPTAYPKRAGVLADWGLGLSWPNEPSDEGKQGFVTGTFPFIATELLTNHGLGGSVTHQPHHDLESLFWVLWVLSINYEGPYGKRRKWKTTDGQVLYDSSARQPLRQFHSASCDPATRASGPSDHEKSPLYTIPAARLTVSESSPGAPVDPLLVFDNNNTPVFQDTPYNPSTASQYIETTTSPTVHGGVHRYADDVDGLVAVAPVWATPEIHNCTFEDIYQWKVNAFMVADKDLVRPISPYFKNGSGGQEFKEGIAKLAERFKWDASGAQDLPPKIPITHAEFCHILGTMRDAIDSTDQPTEDDIERARILFQKEKNLQLNNLEGGEENPNPESAFEAHASQKQASGSKRRSSSRMISKGKRIRASGPDA